MRYTAILFLLTVTPCFGQVHSADVSLSVSDGRIVTGERVYGAEFGEIIPNEVDEPGFDSEPGTFPAGSSIGFSILDTLRSWDGSDFDTIPDETVSIGFGTSLGPITTPTTPSIVEGFDLNVSGDGAWHRHFDFVLNSPASTGIYLLQMQLESSAPSIEPSKPLFLVFNQNDSEANHDAAISFVETTIIPEPASGAILLSGVMLLCSCRVFLPQRHGGTEKIL